MDFDRLPSFIASFCLHLIIAALMIFMPENSPPPPTPPGAVMLSGIVTIGKEGRSAQGKQETPDSGKGREENNSVPPKPVEAPQPPAQVTQPPEPQVTARPPDPEAAVIPKTPEKPEPKKPDPPKEEVKKTEAPKPEPKKPDPPRPEPQKTPAKTPPPKKEDLSSALADLGREVSKSGQGNRSGTAKGSNRDSTGRDLSRALADMGKNVGGVGDGPSGNGPGGSGGDGLGILGAYQESVISRVRPNWALPARADRKSYTAVVNIKIDKDGTILEARIIKPSGNSFFDSSVMQAVAATRILEPPPHAGYSSIDISFTPEALSAN